jgi:hypothetical protein
MDEKMNADKFRRLSSKRNGRPSVFLSITPHPSGAVFHLPSVFSQRF